MRAEAREGAADTRRFVGAGGAGGLVAGPDSTMRLRCMTTSHRRAGGQAEVARDEHDGGAHPECELAEVVEMRRWTVTSRRRRRLVGDQQLGGARPCRDGDEGALAHAAGELSAGTAWRGMFRAGQAGFRGGW